MWAPRNIAQDFSRKCTPLGFTLNGIPMERMGGGLRGKAEINRGPKSNGWFAHRARVNKQSDQFVIE